MEIVSMQLEERQFYVKLYSSKRKSFTDYEAIKNDFVHDLKTPQLKADDLLEVASEITESEIYQAIQLAADNKSPGTDGLGNEFY